MIEKKTIQVSADDVLELKLLKQRLEQELRDGRRHGDVSVTRTTSGDREVEVLERIVRSAS